MIRLRRFRQSARLASSAPIAKRASARFRIHRDPMTRSLCHVLCCSLLLVSGAFPAQKEDLAAESQRAKQAMTEGRFEEAAALYGELVRAEPGDAGFVLDLGLALHSAGRYREAARQFEAYLKRRPDSGPVWLLLGLDYQNLGDPQHAIRPL
ncbi:MAG: hypothetical protein DMG24_20900, partial [Acidobacteria bacterium]